MSTSYRLVERVEQLGQTLRVTRGGREITLKDIDSSQDWRSLPGETVIHGCRMLNAKSKNGHIYESDFIRKAAQIHNDNHDVAIEHEDTTGNARPVLTRFGRTFNSKLVESAGEIVGFNADVGIYEGDQVLADSLAVRALRNPKSMMFSIEVERGQWGGERDSTGTMRINRLQEMLDTCLVSRGGTTRSLKESDQRNQKMENENTDLAKRLQEMCTKCANQEADIEGLKQQRDAAIAERDALQAKFDALEVKVQESERRQMVVAQAKKLGIDTARLTEEKIGRLAVHDDAGLEAELKELKESLGSSAQHGYDNGDGRLVERELHAAPTGSEDQSDNQGSSWLDDVPDYGARVL